MNFLKSLFIGSFTMLAMAIAGFSGWVIYRGWPPLAWAGVLLTVGPFLVRIGRFLVVQNLVRISARPPFLNFSGSVGCGLALWGWHEGQAGILAPGLAIIGWLGVVLSAHWYSRNRREPVGNGRAGDMP